MQCLLLSSKNAHWVSLNDLNTGLLPWQKANKLRNRLSSDIVDSIIFIQNSIPQDIKKDATESEFANFIGM